MGIRSQFRRQSSKKTSPKEVPPPPNPLLQEAKRQLARKRFGQNFLVNPGIIDGITRSLDLTPQDTLLEIGPGLGFLTRSLLPQVKQLLAVELDRRMVAYLEAHFAQHPQRDALSIINQDIMAFDPACIEAPRFKIVGNLPYNITSGVLFKFAGELTEESMVLRNRLQQLTFMVQKEVGERIVAAPGSKTYGPLSVALQYWFDCEKEFYVAPDAFEPQPKVTSVVVSLYPRKAGRYPVENLSLMNQIVRHAFQQRRKMLRNSLTPLVEGRVECLEAALAQSNLFPTLRPEQLSIEDFARLTNALHAQIKVC